MKKAFLCGILASFFFAFTFLLNSSMNLSGDTGCGVRACATS